MPVDISDIDGDGDLDFAVAHNIYRNCKMVTYLNDGVGSFSRGNTYSVQGYQVNSATAGDLNGDSYIDIIVAGFSNTDDIFDISIFLNAGPFICGDANGDDNVNILDIVYLINGLYKGGPPPVPEESADVNSDGIVNILDIVYLVNAIYKDGPDVFCP
jgi:hypothetical protein